MTRVSKFAVTVHADMRNIRVTVPAASIIDAIVKVCETQEVPHRAVLEARKVR